MKKQRRHKCSECGADICSTCNCAGGIFCSKCDATTCDICAD